MGSNILYILLFYEWWSRTRTPDIQRKVPEVFVLLLLHVKVAHRVRANGGTRWLHVIDLLLELGLR